MRPDDCISRIRSFSLLTICRSCFNLAISSSRASICFFLAPFGSNALTCRAGWALSCRGRSSEGLSVSPGGSVKLCIGSTGLLPGFLGGWLAFDGFKGELFFGLGLSLHRDGLLCMPFGGLKEAESGTEGGSSGSGKAMGRPVFGDLRCLLPKNESASSSPSGAGGGKGRGLGLKGDLMGNPTELPSAGPDDGSDPRLCAASSFPRADAFAAAVGASVASSTASRADPSVVGGGADCSSSSECGWLRAPPALVCLDLGGRLAAGMGECWDDSIASSLLELPMFMEEVRGETRRLFDAGPSIVEKSQRDLYGETIRKKRKLYCDNNGT